MHAFILVCDINNCQSLRNVPDWLKQIEERAQITDGRQVMVLVNKIDTLTWMGTQSDADNTAYMLSQSRIQIQEEILVEMRQRVAKDYPEVSIFEVSAKLDMGLKESISALGQALNRNKQKFVQQRY